MAASPSGQSKRCWTPSLSDGHTTHTRTHAHQHACTHARTHRHTHTHLHTPAPLRMRCSHGVAGPPATAPGATYTSLSPRVGRPALRRGSSCWPWIGGFPSGVFHARNWGGRGAQPCKQSSGWRRCLACHSHCTTRPAGCNDACGTCSCRHMTASGIPSCCSNCGEDGEARLACAWCMCASVVCVGPES